MVFFISEAMELIETVGGVIELREGCLYHGIEVPLATHINYN